MQCASSWNACTIYDQRDKERIRDTGTIKEGITIVLKGIVSMGAPEKGTIAWHRPMSAATFLVGNVKDTSPSWGYKKCT